MCVCVCEFVSVCVWLTFYKSISFGNKMTVFVQFLSRIPVHDVAVELWSFISSPVSYILEIHFGTKTKTIVQFIYIAPSNGMP